MERSRRRRRAPGGLAAALIAAALGGCRPEAPVTDPPLEAAATNPRLVAATYFGGSGDEQIRDVVVGGKGFLFVCGRTSSRDLPAGDGTVQPRHGGGGSDAFVAKLAPDLRRTVWLTYLGGSGYEVAYGIGLDAEGNVYVGGRTSSRDLPATKGAFDTSYNGGPSKPPYHGGDAFVASLSPDGSRLRYCTYVGGSGIEAGRNLAVDPATGCAYVTGATSSPDFPTTPGALQPEHGGGSWDAFAVRVSPDGSRLDYSTFLGGSEEDRGEAVDVGPDGLAVVGGATRGRGFPTTEGALQDESRGGLDVWIARVAADGGKLSYATLIGGAGDDGVEQAALTVDARGAAWVCGFTHSKDFPTTKGAYRRKTSGPIDNVLLRVSPDGRRLEAATLFGGSGPWETAFGAPVEDGSGGVLVAGATSCRDFPVTADAAQREHAGRQDAFLVRFPRDLSGLLFATMLGAGGSDTGRGLARAAEGAVFMIGHTGSARFPTTRGTLMQHHQRGGDGFVVRFDP